VSPCREQSHLPCASGSETQRCLFDRRDSDAASLNHDPDCGPALRTSRSTSRATHHSPRIVANLKPTHPLRRPGPPLPERAFRRAGGLLLRSPQRPPGSAHLGEPPARAGPAARAIAAPPPPRCGLPRAEQLRPVEPAGVRQHANSRATAPQSIRDLGRVESAFTRQSTMAPVVHSRPASSEDLVQQHALAMHAPAPRTALRMLQRRARCGLHHAGGAPAVRLHWPHGTAPR
jgi:hypothetical protein